MGKTGDKKLSAKGTVQTGTENKGKGEIPSKDARRTISTKHAIGEIKGSVVLTDLFCKANVVRVFNPDTLEFEKQIDWVANQTIIQINYHHRKVREIELIFSIERNETWREALAAPFSYSVNIFSPILHELKTMENARILVQNKQESQKKENERTRIDRLVKFTAKEILSKIWVWNEGDLSVEYIEKSGDFDIKYYFHNHLLAVPSLQMERYLNRQEMLALLEDALWKAYRSTIKYSLWLEIRTYSNEEWELEREYDKEVEGNSFWKTAWEIVKPDASDIVFAIFGGSVLKRVIKLRKVTNVRKVEKAIKFSKNIQKYLQAADKFKDFVALVKAVSNDLIFQIIGFLSKRELFTKIYTDFVASSANVKNRVTKELIAEFIDQYTIYKKPRIKWLNMAAIAVAKNKRLELTKKFLTSYLWHAIQHRFVVNITYAMTRNLYSDSELNFREIVLNTVGETVEDTFRGIPGWTETKFTKDLITILRKLIITNIK